MLMPPRPFGELLLFQSGADQRGQVAAYDCNAVGSEVWTSIIADCERP